MRIRDAKVKSTSPFDAQRKIMEYLSLPREERLEKLETLTNAERNLAKKMWLKMHQSETVVNIGGLY